MYFIKKKIIFAVFSIVFAVLIVSCQLISSKPESLITIHNTGKNLYVKMNDSFNISLDSNPTTGYSWEILPYNDSIIRFIKSKYKPNSDRIGSDGKRIIEFKALNKGKTVLELSYLRVWEKKIRPIKKFKITVVVE